jgi:hypothetical protein
MPNSLDAAAVRKADEAIYARHAGDPRPNALYDAHGRRTPLDASAPDQSSLRAEWRDLYMVAASSTSETPLHPSTPGQPGVNTPVGRVTQACPLGHYISIALVAAPDRQQRPVWWPPRKETFAQEPFSANITDGRRLETLDETGAAVYTGIPAGTSDILFYQFYADIERTLDATMPAPAC